MNNREAQDVETTSADSTVAQSRVKAFIKGESGTTSTLDKITSEQPTEEYARDSTSEVRDDSDRVIVSVDTLSLQSTVTRIMAKFEVDEEIARLEQNIGMSVEEFLLAREKGIAPDSFEARLLSMLLKQC